MNTPFNWRQKYLLKHAVQKAVGSTPGMYRVQESFKRITGRWTSRLSVETILADATDTARRLGNAGVASPKIVVEQGTGWHGLDALMFFLAGAERVITYDVRPWLREELFRFVCRNAGGLAHTLQHWDNFPEEQTGARVALAVDAAELPLPEALARLGIEYRVTRKMDRQEIESSTVDLFYSNSVLQRLVRAELEELIDQSRRLLRPSGISVHRIDCKDFHSITDPRVPELYYLGFSEAAWRAGTSKYLNGQNRLRRPHFEQCFQRSGFATEIAWQTVTDENLAFVRSMQPRPDWLSTLAAEEVAVSRFDLTAIPQSSAHEAAA